MKTKLAVLTGAALFGAVALAFSGQNDTGRNPALQREIAQATADTGATARVPENRKEIELSFAPVAKAVRPAVVNVFTAKVVRQRQQMGPFFSLFPSQPRVENALGSGVIIDGKGLIITNNHVVDGADQILVALSDRREFPAKLLFSDPRLDLALLQIDPKGAALPTAHLGDSDRAEVGDLVLAIGNPFGVGQTVTQGIVSATARTGIGVSDAQFFIQTDASINQGNSGGALVAMDGDVIGINSAILTGSDGGGSIGLGFAIPSNIVKIFLRGAAQGRIVTSWLGVDGESLTNDTARLANLPSPTGVLVTGISRNSPAASAGLKGGDIIEAIDGREVDDPDALRYRISTRPVGQSVTLTVVRDGKAENRKVTLTAPPETPPRQLTALPNGTILAGVSIANLSPALVQEMGAGLPDKGVVVVKVPPQAPAAQLGFPQAGDVLQNVNGKAVASVDDVKAALSARSGGTSFTLGRGGRTVACVFQPPGNFGCRTSQPG